MKKIWILTLITCLLLASCGGNSQTSSQNSEPTSASSVSESSESSAENETESEAESGNENGNESESSESSDILDETSAQTSSEPETEESSAETVPETEETLQPAVHTGDVDLKSFPADARSWIYDSRFTSIPFELQAEAGGVGAVEAWAGERGWIINLADFFHDFEMTADQVNSILFDQQLEIPPDITAEEVEILCSDDWAAINNLMVSPYAVASETGDIYTIFWLGEHSAEDYAKAGLDAEAIASAIQQTQALNIQETDSYCEQAQQSLASYQALQP